MPVLIPATILFDEEQMQLYARWQTEQPYIPQNRYDTLPTAFEYEEYVTWRDQLRGHYPFETPSSNSVSVDDTTEDTGGYPSSIVQDSDSKALVAKMCKHPLHPLTEERGLQELPKRCPLCIMRAHLSLLATLEERWAQLGGPWRQCDWVDEAQRAQYQIGTRAYHRAKVDMINTMEDVEDWVEIESQWETNHPGADVTVAAPFSAKAAMELFEKEHSHLIAPSSGSLEDGKSEANVLRVEEKSKSTPTQPLKRNQDVSFTPDTLDTHNRPNTAYSRACTGYDPESPYSCPDEEGWQDTSFIKDYRYCLSQCRILLMVYDPEKTPDVIYKDLNVGPDRGDNRHVDRLHMLVAEWLSTQADEERLWHMESLSNTTDLFFVHTADWDEGDNFDMFYHHTTLVGTLLEAYARMIGDIDEDEVQADNEMKEGSESKGGDSEMSFPESG